MGTRHVTRDSIHFTILGSQLLLLQISFRVIFLITNNNYLETFVKVGTKYHSEFKYSLLTEPIKCEKVNKSFLIKKSFT